MNIRHARLVKYTSLTVGVYFLFLYGRTEQTDSTDRASTAVRRQGIEGPKVESSMSTTLASTTSSAMFYSDELEKGNEMGEIEEPIRANMTDLDVRKDTEAFLEDNKLRIANIRF